MYYIFNEKSKSRCAAIIAMKAYFPAWQFPRFHFIASYLLLMVGIYYPLLELSPLFFLEIPSNFDLISIVVFVFFLFQSFNSSSSICLSITLIPCQHSICWSLLTSFTSDQPMVQKTWCGKKRWKRWSLNFENYIRTQQN